MNHVVSIAKRPESHCEKPANSYLVKAVEGTRCRESLAQNPTSSNPQSRNQRRINVDRVSISGGSGDVANSLGEFRRTAQKANGRELSKSEPVKTRRATSNADSYSRCFSQFDRKTDCFDGGTWFYTARQAHFKGSRQKAMDVSPDATNGDSADTEHGAKGLVWRTNTTFKAVCVTQTRQDGSLNKNQPDSQSFEVNGLAFHAGTRIRSRGANSGPTSSIDPATSFWQKPGIGVAADKSSPIKGADKEKETSTRYGYR